MIYQPCWQGGPYSAFTKKTTPGPAGKRQLGAWAAESSAPSVHITYGKLAPRSRHRGCSPRPGRQRPGLGQMSSDKACKASKTCKRYTQCLQEDKHASTG